MGSIEVYRALESKDGYWNLEFGQYRVSRIEFRN